jgi:GTP pyrophosphokinase
MAADLHRHQVRKGTELRPVPYLSHVLEVAAVVLAEPVPEDVAIAALLHDGPEDAGGRQVLEAIRDAFGDRVAEIVDACTDTHEKKKPPWIERKQRYLDRLRATDDFDVLVVKCADCLSNARATLRDYRLIGDRVWERFTGMPCASCQRWWYASVREALRRLGLSAGCFADYDQAVSALLRETRPSDRADHVHPAMPEVPQSADEELDALVVGGFDPLHRCPICQHVPIAPAGGFGRLCPHCGHQWEIK